MNLIMAQPNTNKQRRGFFGSLRFIGGPVIDPDFDNDNERPPTGEVLDWTNTRRTTQLT